MADVRPKGGAPLSISRTLDLTFITESNQSHRISIPDSRSDLDNTQINSAMNNLIAYSVFTGNGGNLTGKKAAQLTTRETQSFEIL